VETTEIAKSTRKEKTFSNLPLQNGMLWQNPTNNWE
jgi:hypothetical protein